MSTFLGDLGIGPVQSASSPPYYLSTDKVPLQSTGASSAGPKAPTSSAAGGIMLIASAVMSGISGFYGALSQKSQLKSQAQSLELQATLDDLNARGSDQDAERILEAGNQQLGYRGLANAQQKGEQRASFAARGVQLGVGNTAEVQASTELAHELDALTIRKNTAAAAGAQRLNTVNLQTRANMERVSAGNMRRSARSINPWLAAGSSLLGSAGPAAAQWSY